MNMMGNPASRSLRTGEQRSFGELPPPRAGRYHSLFDEEWLNHHYHEHSPQTLRNAPVAPRSLSGDAQHLDISTPLQLNPNMSEVERSTVAQLVARGVTTWPSEYRRTMAATMLEHIAWGDIGQGKDMLKDEYCSVCHDEVSLISMVL